MQQHTPAAQASDSATLYAACAGADPQEQAAAYRELWRYLYRVTRCIVRDQPNPDDLAQDCAQKALVRVHRRLDECREPAAFRTWARRIASHIAIDELRRRKRLLPLPDTEPDPLPSERPSPETRALTDLYNATLRDLIDHAPISERSYRVVVGRYFEEETDEILAERESNHAGQEVLPSHIQVTRSKNMTKLRRWDLLQAFVGNRAKNEER